MDICFSLYTPFTCVKNLKI